MGQQLFRGVPAMAGCEALSVKLRSNVRCEAARGQDGGACDVKQLRSEKVMTPNPECATLDTTILDALHLMRDGKFLHLPVIDRDGNISACLDVQQITHAAISMVEGGGAANDMANTMMQKFWDSALALEPPDEDYDTRSELSGLVPSEYTDTAKSIYPPLLGNSFSFKIEDQKGRVHRFNCGTDSLDELVYAIIQRLGLEDSKEKIQLLYLDDEGDRVLLATDNDLVGAVNHAKLAGSKVLRLHIDSSHTTQEAIKPTPDLAVVQKSQLAPLMSAVVAGAVVLGGMGLMFCLKRAKL